MNTKKLGISGVHTAADLDKILDKTSSVSVVKSSRSRSSVVVEVVRRKKNLGIRTPTPPLQDKVEEKTHGDISSDRLSVLRGVLSQTANTEASGVSPSSPTEAEKPSVVKKDDTDNVVRPDVILGDIAPDRMTSKGKYADKTKYSDKDREHPKVRTKVKESTAKITHVDVRNILIDDSDNLVTDSSSTPVDNADVFPVKSKIDEVKIATSPVDRKSKKVRKKSTEKNVDSLSRVSSPSVISVPANITLRSLAGYMKLKVQCLCKKSKNIGIQCDENSILDDDSLHLLALECGFECKIKQEETLKDVLARCTVSLPHTQKRGVTYLVVGHVNHGKSTLVEILSGVTFVRREIGNITQHISAYSFKLPSVGNSILLDTPGHEAFCKIRSTGVKATDCALIVIAADDSVQPQTKESIEYVLSINVPLIVVVTKIDLPAANVEKVYRDLCVLGVTVDKMGGEVVSVEISATTGHNIPLLIDVMGLQAELLELTCNFDNTGVGIVLETTVEKGKGIVATVLVRDGTFRVGDFIASNGVSGRIRSLLDTKNKNIKTVTGLDCVKMIGLRDMPVVGCNLYGTSTESGAKQVQDVLGTVDVDDGDVTVSDMEELADSGQRLNIIIKADSQGSIDAILQILKDVDKKIDARVIRIGVGDVTANNVILAKKTGSIILMFNVGVESNAKGFLKNTDVILYSNNVVYKLIEELLADHAIREVPSFDFEPFVTGKAEVVRIFSLKCGKVFGCKLLSGTVAVGNRVHIVNAGSILGSAKVLSLNDKQNSVQKLDAIKEFGLMTDKSGKITSGCVLFFVSEEG